MELILTADVAECPGCGAPLVRDTERQRHCNGCGLVAVYVSDFDQQEADEMAKIPGQERGRRTPLGKFQRTW